MWWRNWSLKKTLFKSYRRADRHTLIMWTACIQSDTHVLLYGHTHGHHPREDQGRNGLMPIWTSHYTRPLASLRTGHHEGTLFSIRCQRAMSQLQYVKSLFHRGQSLVRGWYSRRTLNTLTLTTHSCICTAVAMIQHASTIIRLKHCIQDINQWMSGWSGTVLV